MINKGTWVQIHRIELAPNERANHLPDDTKKVPLELWVKGFLLEDASIGDNVSIKTVTGRIEKGKLIEANPSYRHSFGNFVSEILEIDKIVKKELFGDEIYD
ncbi:MAG TPA: 2-amino-4-oxopentanoate thiolase subunit OrtA [Haloplasmataceae bacterium]